MQGKWEKVAKGVGKVGKSSKDGKRVGKRREKRENVEKG